LESRAGIPPTPHYHSYSPPLLFSFSRWDLTAIIPMPPLLSKRSQALRFPTASACHIL
jgi:hypothetical protein